MSSQLQSDGTTPTISSRPTPSGSTPKTHPNNKPCTLCHTPQPVLVRCQIDDTGTWHLKCPGKCWKSVSGGVEDARGKEGDYPYYRYGGMWKNKHAGVSAKKPKRAKVGKKGKEGQEDDSSDDEPPSTLSDPVLPTQPDHPSHSRTWQSHTPFTRNDKITHADQAYICRQSHTSQAEGEGSGPGEKRGYRYWKEDDDFGKDFTAAESDGGNVDS